MGKRMAAGVWLALVLLLSAGLTGCGDHDAPSVTGPAAFAQTQTNFFAYGGLSEQIGVYYNGDLFFQVQVPTGDYLLTYTTDLGNFYVVFRASAKAIVTIGLQRGDIVHEAVLFKGTITVTASTLTSGPVAVFSVLGAREGWETLFVKEPNAVGVLLLGGLAATYTPGVELKLIIPQPGHYLVKYVSNLGAQQVEFWTTKWYETKIIPLQPGEDIRQANLLRLDDAATTAKKVLLP